MLQIHGVFKLIATLYSSKQGCYKMVISVQAVYQQLFIQHYGKFKTSSKHLHEKSKFKHYMIHIDSLHSDKYICMQCAN